MPSVSRRIFVIAGCLLCLGWGIARADQATADADTLQAALTSPAGPGPALVQNGDTLTVRLEIMASGPAFNAFDAYIRFDPAVLSFLPPASQQDQVGPLMSEACNQSFHLFSQAPDSMTLEINFSLLCGGVSVTGPGVAYQVRFRCRDVDAYTRLDLLTESGRITRFYDNGYYVEPLALTPLLVQAGAGAAPAQTPGGQGILLRAAPNPFNPRTVFSFHLPRNGSVNLAVYDVRGRRVRRLLDETRGPGPGQVAWDGRDDAGRRVEAGVYFGVVHAAGLTGRTEMTVLK